MGAKSETELLKDIGEYQYGFSDPDTYVFRSSKGLSREVVEQISQMKGEPEWMLDFRLKALEHFQKRPMPTWGADLSKLNLDEYLLLCQADRKREQDPGTMSRTTIKKTFDQLGHPRGRAEVPGWRWRAV